MVKFLVIWFGQLVSLFGSGLTTFALGIWVYQRTGSFTKFSLICVFAVLPNVLICPLAGAIVDRRNRRTIMLWSDSVAGVGTFMLALLFLAHWLVIWEIYLLVAVNALVGAFRLPSYMALLSQLVPLHQVGRASGMMQLGPASTQVLSPIMAAALIGLIGFQGVVLIDFTTFLFAIGTLVMVKVPSLSALSVTGKRSLLKEAAQGWRYIMMRPGLKRLLVFFWFLNITYSFSQVLLTPMILAFASSGVLGAIMSIGAIGFLAGSILMTVWGGPKRRIHGLMGFTLPYGVGLVLSGLRPSVWLITVAIFLVLFEVPLINGCNQAIWQSKTPLELQGRVFATRMMLAWSSAPLSFFLAGLLAERVFEPLLGPRGRLAGSWISAIGVGPGRGAALLLVLSGILALLVAIGFCFSRRMRHMEDELPDSIPAQQTAAAVS